MRKMATMLVAAVAAMGVACSSDDSNSVTGPDGVAVPGVYQMQTIAGQKLPYLLYQQGTMSITVVDGQLNVAADGTWTEVVNLRTVSDTGTVTQAVNADGAWYRSGSSLLFAYGLDNSTYYTGVASPNRLDLDAGGGLMVVYMK